MGLASVDSFLRCWSAWREPPAAGHLYRPVFQHHAEGFLLRGWGKGLPFTHMSQSPAQTGVPSLPGTRREGPVVSIPTSVCVPESPASLPLREASAWEIVTRRWTRFIALKTQPPLGAYGELLLPGQGKLQVKRYAQCLGPLGHPHSDLPCGPHGPGHGGRGQAAADRKPNCVTKETLKLSDSGPPLPAQISEL
uniref:Uncharacterized protein n=1 Tax=Rangifer tarandus platyrhynchus TaxID=3082113 RepID=A0ACB0DZD8_RANTA|nr:unnamed protein product [Rangifer tarandus platyrhynchus]